MIRLRPGHLHKGVEVLLGIGIDRGLVRFDAGADIEVIRRERVGCADGLALAERDFLRDGADSGRVDWDAARDVLCARRGGDIHGLHGVQWNVAPGGDELHRVSDARFCRDGDRECPRGFVEADVLEIETAGGVEVAALHRLEKRLWGEGLRADADPAIADERMVARAAAGIVVGVLGCQTV